MTFTKYLSIEKKKNKPAFSKRGSKSSLDIKLPLSIFQEMGFEILHN